MRRVHLAALSVIVVGVAMLTAVPAGATYPGSNGRIAFVRAGDIYTVTATGTGLTRLTTTGNNANPAWSADGQRIAFDSTRTGGGDVYVMQADGTGVQRITVGAAREQNPTWSPDGKQLAYAVSSSCKLWVIRIAPTRGTPTAVVSACSNPDLGFIFDEPDWSPDGTRIAYSRYKYDATGGSFFNSQDLAYVTVATRAQRDVYSSNLFEYQSSPDWAPGGRALLFDCYDDGGDSELCPDAASGNVFRILATGSGATQLTHGGGTEPAGSPDGTLFAYTYISPTDGSKQIRIGNSRGALVRTLARNASQADWQPLP